MISVEVVGVRVEMPSNQPIVLLREKDSIRYLPIWVGAVEATAIAFAQQGISSVRPLTHDLLIDVIAALKSGISAIHITQLRDGIFYAELILQSGEKVSARPSDAIALGLRTGAPILASDELFNQAGIEIPASSEDEVERFKEFLDQVNPEDFLG
jgi:uncharacterized protein